ncbi:MAG: hypothetical protein AAFR18_11745 [Cyanobacteria bacterium J06627_32]
MSAQNLSLEQREQQAMHDFEVRMQDPQIALEDVRIETEANCTIGAGYDWGAHLGTVLTHPHGSYQYRRIRSLVMRELWQLLEDCDLGAGFSDAFKVGRQCLTERLKQPSEEIQQLLLNTFDESMTAQGPKEVLSESTCAALQAVIYAVLLKQDWEAISSAATTAIQLHLRQKIAGVDAA